MTPLLLATLGVFFAYAVYLATASARQTGAPHDFLDGGLALPGWGYIFAGMGVAIAALDLESHLLLIARYGLQYSHAALGLVLAAVAAALIHGRLWTIARMTGIATPGRLLGDYYGSTAIMLYVLLVLMLFALPFSAVLLSQTGALVEMATAGAAPAGLVIWGSAFFLALYTIIGGWRGLIYVLAGQSLIVLALLLATSGAAGIAAHGLSFASYGIAVPAGVTSDRLPGVIQFTAGLGKSVPLAGLWTTTQIASFALALTGITLSPGFLLLGVSTRTRTGLAFSQVWMVAGVAAGLLLLLGPVLGAELSRSPRLSLEAFAGLISRLANVDQLFAAGLVIMLIVSQQIAVAFFAVSGASIVTSDLIKRFVLPDLTPAGERLTARIAIALIFIAMAVLADILPLPALLLSGVALSLSVQLLPALLGVCWLPWVNRNGVVTGLIAGLLFVGFTEAAGLVAFEAVAIDLPWGRWPLTIHSAAWGLVFNIAFCVIVSLWSRQRETAASRDTRRRLHEGLERASPVRFGGRATRAARWSLTLLWVFLALGPGAILGNGLFSRETFGFAGTGGQMPSLLVWQIAAWFTGVLLVWWLAYQGRLGVVADTRVNVAITPPASPLTTDRRPRWISRMLGRLTQRSGPGEAGARAQR